jgi:hypothetical protein
MKGPHGEACQEAVDTNAAIAEAAKRFDVKEVRKLIAVQRR